MSPEDLASLHRQCFTTPRPWSADEFAGLVAGTGCFLLSRPQGFLLGRVIADEAELLTIAVAPAARRAGLGRNLCLEFASQAQAAGAASAFLEVAADNPAARQLYAGLGWRQSGLRRGYYGQGLDALILGLKLTGDQGTAADFPTSDIR